MESHAKKRRALCSRPFFSLFRCDVCGRRKTYPRDVFRFAGAHPRLESARGPQQALILADETTGAWENREAWQTQILQTSSHCLYEHLKKRHLILFEYTFNMI